LTLKPRWVHPLNFREQDKVVLDQALELAKREGSDLTNVIRKALQEYTQRMSANNASLTKMDVFLTDVEYRAYPQYTKVLTPEELEEWSDSDLLTFAKFTRSRKQEIQAELQRRGFYFFEW